jgi:hypothetical protein
MTAVRVGLRSSRLCLIVAALLAVSACGGARAAPVARVTSKPSAQVSPRASPSASHAITPPTASPAPSTNPTASTAPAIACQGGASNGPMVLVRGWYMEPWMLYDVSDPTHPRLLCKISDTSAHLFTADTFEYLEPRSATETDVILHSLGSGNESIAGKFPFAESFGAWKADLSEMAYTVSRSDGVVEVWLYAQQKNAVLFTYQQPQVGCICRFGVPSPALAISPDGQYVAAGPGIGAQTLAVYRIADRFRVATLTSSAPFWDRMGHRLFLAGGAANAGSWTPEGGLAPLAGATAWPFLPSVSPDGADVAYTDYSDPGVEVQPRVYVYDVNSATTRTLIDKPRTQDIFVKDGWAWYLEEATCDPASCTGPVSTLPTGSVFAMQLSTGTELPVIFAAGANPVAQSTGADFASFAPGDYWPTS